MNDSVSTLPLISRKASGFSGTLKVPGDKSISHRSLMFGALAREETMIAGLLEGEDVLNTATAMRALGARIERGGDGLWRIFGVGVGLLKQPETVLDMGNSGTSTRLLMGLCATHDIHASFTGDASLVKRPMKRVIDPLSQFGATFDTAEGGRLPLTIHGKAGGRGIEYRLPVASAQVKSAILLAGLNASGETTVIESIPTRDHSENMLRHFGVPVRIETLSDGAQAITVSGGHELQGCAIDVPADPSSAGFPAVAALLVPGAAVKIINVCVNERRTGLYRTLKDMGAAITFGKIQNVAGEPVCDITITGGGPLHGITVPPERVPSMIDEFPILAIAASCSHGVTHMSGLAELRVKESDRLKMMAEGLSACGVKLEMGEESLTIYGTGKPPHGGATIKTELDHRIAMSFLVLGMVSDEPICIDDASPIKTSFPDFVALMNGSGARFGSP